MNGENKLLGTLRSGLEVWSLGPPEYVAQLRTERKQDASARNGQRRNSQRPEPEPGPPPDPLAAMFDGNWLDAQQFPPLEFAVPGIVPEGLVFAVGPPKLGKSFLVLDFALACACGGKALGAIKVERRPVLYLALEDGQRRLQSRCRSLMADQPIPAGLHFVTEAHHREVLPMVAEFLARHRQDMPLVVLDTLGRARPPRPAGADPYQWDYAIGTQLKATVDTVPGATLLVVHHTRKQLAADFVDSVSGTHGIAGSADAVLVLRRMRQRDDATLQVTGRDIAEGEYALRVDGGFRWRLDGGRLDVAAATAQKRREAGKLGDRALEVLGFVNARPETTPADVASKLDMDSKRASETLIRLADSRRIRRVRRGTYAKAFSAPAESGAENFRDPDQPIPHIPQNPHIEDNTPPCPTTAESAESAENAGQRPFPFPHRGAESAENCGKGAENEPDLARCGCGHPLDTQEERRRGNCARCFLRSKSAADSEPDIFATICFGDKDDEQ